MSVTVTVARKERDPKPTLDWWIRPKYLIDIRIDKTWMAFRFSLANPLRVRYSRQILKRHQKLKDGMRPFYEVRNDTPLDVSFIPEHRRPLWWR